MIRTAEKADAALIAEMAAMMWEGSAEALAREFSEILSKDSARVFLKYAGDVPAGFAQCQLRQDYVEGTQTSPVGYLEGIFVKAAFRRRGYAGELLRACEAWAKSRGCTEFASDCETSNTESLRFHQAMGFAEANRIICFTKKL